MGFILFYSVVYITIYENSILQNNLGTAKYV